MPKTLTQHLGLADNATDDEIFNAVVDMKTNVEVLLLPTLQTIAAEGDERAEKAIAMFKGTHHGEQVF